MPRRGLEVSELLSSPSKRAKTLEKPPESCTPSLDVSFCDDEALRPGIIFTDVNKKKWRLGKPIGRGSFGRIYLASDDIDKEVSKIYARYVVKIEPHTNGPLFVEIHCLKRTAKAQKLKEWRQEHNQRRLGMPVYIASGSFTDEASGIKYRFLVLPRYDADLHKIFSIFKVFDVKHVLVLAIQILDVLEYLHNDGYTHSDIKSSNLMIGINYPSKTVVNQSSPFQKELSRKDSKSKVGKSRSSNYYIDEDFIMKDFKKHSKPDDENAKRLKNVTKKLSKILSDKNSRNLHRHNVFNLRQLANCANYEDFNSSVCSDQSYQKLIDDFGNKNDIQTTKEFQKSKAKSAKVKSVPINDELYKEAVMSQSAGQIYLLDYGLASKFLDSEGKHKEFGMDLRKAHDGTLEYSSRDSHIGAHSRRSDLETLGYNLLEWLTGRLPWKAPEVLKEPDLVHALKKNYMSDIKLLLKTCFKTDLYPQFLETYLQYITTLDFTEKPDYDYCRNLFKTELCKNGNKPLTLNFSEIIKNFVERRNWNTNWNWHRIGKTKTPKATDLDGKVCVRQNISFENGVRLEIIRKIYNISRERKPCTTGTYFVSNADLVARLRKSLLPHGVFSKKLSPKNLRSKQKPIQKRRGIRRHRNSIGKFGNFMGSARQFTWAEILAQNPEHIIRKERNVANDGDDDDDTCKYRIRKLSNASSESDSSVQSPILQRDYLQDMNPTDAMKEVINSLKNKLSRKSAKEPEANPENLKGYTPAMIKVYRMKEKREAKEKLEALKQNSPKKDVQMQRNTRSSKNNTVKKPPEPSSRVTRQQATVKSVEKTKVKKNVAPKRKGRSKSNSNKINNAGTTEVEKNVAPKKNCGSKSNSNNIKSVENAEVDKVIAPKRKGTSQSNSNKTVPSKKEVKIVEETKPTEPKLVKKSPRKTTSLSLPNRRRLRSSKRNK